MVRKKDNEILSETNEKPEKSEDEPQNEEKVTMVALKKLKHDLKILRSS